MIRTLLLVGVLAAPGVALAGPYMQDGCTIVAPAGWVASKSRIAAPDKKIWAELMQAPTSAEVLKIEQGLGATQVSEDDKIIMLVSTASYGGLTNKQFHAVTKTNPSCVADVTVPAGPQEAAARQIAATVAVAQ